MLTAHELKWLLLSDEGRLGRKVYWLFLAAIVIAAMLLLSLRAFRQSPLAIIAFHLVLLVPCYCVFAKRLQDIDWTGRFALPIILIAAGDALLSAPALRGAGGALHHLAALWWWLSLISSIGLIVIGLVPGTIGANRYGLQR